MKTVRATVCLACVMLLGWNLGESALANDRSLVPPEDLLWRAAGTAYAEGSDKSAAMQQYRLFVQTYGRSQRAAAAQFMLGECYAASGDWAGGLGPAARGRMPVQPRALRRGRREVQPPGQPL